MQIAHECPLVLMEDSRDWTDYDYALAHLFKSNKQYYQYFVDSLKLGRTVIMDNGVFETGTPMPLKELAHWVDKLQPTEYIISDVLENNVQTIENCEKWCSLYKDRFSSSISIGVAQGQNYNDFIWCYNQLVGLVDKIAISFDYKWYRELAPHPNQYVSWMLGRVLLVNRMIQDGVLATSIPHHFLGVSLPIEGKFYNQYQWLESLDTSSPVVHGILGITYEKNFGLYHKESQHLDKIIDCVLTEEQMNRISYNVHEFRKYWTGNKF